MSLRRNMMNGMIKNIMVQIDSGIRNETMPIEAMIAQPNLRSRRLENLSALSFRWRKMQCHQWMCINK